MKYLLILIVFVSGCTQVIIDSDNKRFKVNTLFMTSGLESLYYDPNGFFDVGKYKAIPSDIKLRYNPITKQIEFVAESEK